MLLTNVIRDAVFDGSVDLAFRRWQRPTVRAGGHLRTARGEVDILAVDVIDPAQITDDDARRAGFSSADAVRHELFRERKTRTGTTSVESTAPKGRSRVAKPTEHSLVYRIAMRPGGSDPRVALRENAELSNDEVSAIVAKLAAMDARSSRGPWTERTLDLIATWPARRAPELAEMEGLETLVFKGTVRRLKELGLTESLAVGYRVSPRGEVIRSAIKARQSL